MWYMLAGCTYFNVGRYFVLKFLELVVSIDEVNSKTAIFENGKNLFDTIDDVLRPSLVRCTECFLVAFAETIESLNCVEFYFG